MAKELCLTPRDPGGVETRAEKTCVRESAETIVPGARTGRV